MNIIQWMLLIICIIYGGLTAFGGVIQLKQKKINLWAIWSMILAGILVIILIVFNSIFITFKIYMLIGALALIHAAAVDNGFKLHGKLNPKHHVARLCISLLIVIFFMIK